MVVLGIIFLFSDSSSEKFKVGEKVHATKSGNMFALSSGGPEIFSVQQWLRLKILSIDGSWVHVEYMGNPGFKPYIKAKFLTSGWITYNQYCNASPKCQSQVNAIAERMAKRAAAVVIPTKSQLKRENEQAEAHITPSYKMLSVIEKINSKFIKEGMPAPLVSCKRDSHSSFKCSVVGFSSGSYAYVTTDEATNFEIIGDQQYQEKVFNQVALPLIIAFTPGQTRNNATRILNRLIAKTPSKNGRASTLFYPVWGSVNYHSEPNKIKIIVIGTPLKKTLVDQLR